MDLAATAVLHLTVHQYQTIIDGIFRLNAVLHNTCQLQRLAKLDKFVLILISNFFSSYLRGIFSVRSIFSDLLAVFKIPPNTNFTGRR